MIVVVGATGTVGTAVVRELLQASEAVAALVRDPDRARELLGSRVELREGDLARPETLRTVFAGADRVFLVAPLVPELADLEANAVDAAAVDGVRRVVKLSTAGVAQAGHALPRQYPLHRRAEQHLESSGLAWTHLRPAPFMQNTLAFAASAAADGVIRGAWGEGRMAYVDVRDVAAVAAHVLLADGHEGAAYELTGPQALTVADVAEALSRATGRPVRYEDVAADAVRSALRGRGAPEWFAEAMAEVMAHVRASGTGRVTDAVRQNLGRPARTYEEFAREHAAAFAPND